MQLTSPTLINESAMGTLGLFYTSAPGTTNPQRDAGKAPMKPDVNAVWARGKG